MQALQPGAATALDAATLEAIAGDVPSAFLAAAQVVGQPLVQVMVASGLQPSKAASKSMIKASCMACLVWLSSFTVVIVCVFVRMDEAACATQQSCKQTHHQGKLHVPSGCAVLIYCCGGLCLCVSMIKAICIAQQSCKQGFIGASHTNWLL